MITQQFDIDSLELELGDVCEWFESIQGEGLYAGLPCVFLRFQFCPIRCEMCDTKYSWEKKTSKTKLGSDFFKALFTYKMLVITGGEPLYSDQLPILLNFLKPYRKLLSIHLETSGHITEKYIEKVKEYIDEFDFICISPKQPRFNPRIPFNYEFLLLVKMRNNYILKFVIADEDDILDFVYTFNAYGRDRIYLMPECTTKEEYEQRKDIVMSLAEKYGYKFSPRLHILYGLK